MYTWCSQHYTVLLLKNCVHMSTGLNSLCTRSTSISWCNWCYGEIELFSQVEISFTRILL